ncbi:MAG: transposase domain-containing protein, partial [Planctomycetaceae bacterium]|nr:transposase domain-containing protein [Planctomycetaceae bacterium]
FCEEQGLNPFAYLRDILERLPTQSVNRLEELLPEAWFSDHPEARRKTAAEHLATDRFGIGPRTEGIVRIHLPTVHTDRRGQFVPTRRVIPRPGMPRADSQVRRRGTKASSARRRGGPGGATQGSPHGAARRGRSGSACHARPRGPASGR